MSQISNRPSGLSLLSLLSRTILLWGLLSIISLPALQAQNPYERGKAFYEQRHAHADSFRAEAANINKAIAAFEQSLDQNIMPEEAAAYLLRSYYFKGMFTDISEEQQKKVYEQGRILGEKMMDEYPRSVPIKFWYGANIGRWAKVHGFVKAATNGIAQKLREVCKEIIQLKPSYEGGGGYRILAQVHFHSPRIPILMGWPSDKKAMELIKKALDIAPDHPTNRMLYAQILLEFDRKKEAQEHLQYIINRDIRETHVVEDHYLKHRSRQLLQEHF